MIRGDRARQPIFKIGENDVAGQYILDPEGSSDADSQAIKDDSAGHDAVVDASENGQGAEAFQDEEVAKIDEE